MLILALALAADEAGHSGQQLTNQLAQIQAQTDAKLAALSQQAGFAPEQGFPASFAEVGDEAGLSGLSGLQERLRALRSLTEGRLATVQQKLAKLPSAPSSFLETAADAGALDPSFVELDKRLAEINAKTEAKIHSLFPAAGAAAPSSFAETAAHPAHPHPHPKFVWSSGPQDAKETFGSGFYAGPSSADLEAQLKQQRLDESDTRERLAADLAPLKKLTAAPSSLVQELEWADQGKEYNAFSDEIERITEGTNAKLKDIREADARFTEEQNARMDAVEPAELLKGPPLSLLERGAVASPFEGLAATVDRLEARTKAALGSSLLEEGARQTDLGESFRGLKADLEQVWTDTNTSMATVKAHMAESGELLASPVHASFTALKTKLRALEAKTLADLEQSTAHRDQAKRSLAALGATSFVQTAALRPAGNPAPAFGSFKADLHKLEAQTQQALASPASLLQRAAIEADQGHLRTA